MVLLDRLVTILGTYGTRLVGPRPTADTVLRGVAVHDPAAPEPEEADVLLAVGVQDPLLAVELAERSRALAVVVRTAREDAADPHGEAADRARSGGIALLVVDPAVSWGQAAGVVYGLVLEGGETEAGRGPADLPALADTIAARVGGPVTIEDPGLRVLAYSDRQTEADRARWDTILGRRVPEAVQHHLERTGVVAHLASSAEPVFLPPEPALGLGGRTAAAVRVGREFLGSVWAACEGPLDEERSVSLAEGARTVALHLLRTRVSADLERQVESDLVSRLLEGAMDPTEAAGRLGLAATQHRVVALQAHTPDERHSATLMTFERATTGFGWSRPGRSTVFGSTVYTVLPCGADPAPAREWVAQTTRSLPGHVVVNAGIGAPADLAGLSASRREADESLTLHASRPGRAAVAYDESWDEVLVHRLRMASASGRRPADGPVAELTRHDAAHGTHHTRTLHAWLRAQGDPNRAAEELGVHPNTVRHRMRRMAEVTPLGLDRPRMRLALAIALEANAPGEEGP
ncbi:DNA-binding protein [Nocardiopsis terrae]|uniref:PucR C-terminal helix-turn-helix domain-containing protein n=1 Tax=Nocardiopsis terrae TaxID=372655 RepID=A0ABR9HAL7_9ACTN|nr:helix-turn-helix domain-containing protein [Nocardiopsis terrae]MBE1456077.1 hypothetical protein [Nocardiopsis terrae]GHC96000.1 DNA-binding protein [Nocardiopsis terrae]